jgi:gas vesicle protein
MFSRVKIAIRFFFVGLVVGVLLAPRSGRATRRLLRVRADRLFNELLDTATMGAYETVPGDMTEAEDASDRSNGQASATRKKATAPAQS